MNVRGSYRCGYNGARPRHTYTIPVAQGGQVDKVNVPPTPGPSFKILEDQSKARFGKVTHVNNSKFIGFLKPDSPLPLEYNSSSVFFHFNVIKNNSRNIMEITKGTAVQFTLYEARDGNTEDFTKPKAFAVYTYNTAAEREQQEKAIQKEKKDQKARQNKKLQKDKTNIIIKAEKVTLDENKPKEKNKEMQEIKNKKSDEMIKEAKKVSVFWDLENCRPKKGKVLDIVQEVRDLSHMEGFQEHTFLAVCDVTREPNVLIRDLESANVNVLHRSNKKNSSDEILRQQMRKVVDTSKDAGRIILISGDSDFSTDLHSFRYVKMYETILIHNDKTTTALIKLASRAIPFKSFNQAVEDRENITHADEKVNKKSHRQKAKAPKMNAS